MDEEDLGGGMFDQDVKDMKLGADNAALPQVYDPDELEILDGQLAVFDKPRALKKYKTGTRLYQAQLAQSGVAEGCVQMDVRAPVEQVVAWFNARAPQFDKYMNEDVGMSTVTGERRNEHSVLANLRLPMPSPFEDREFVGVSLWRKLDDNTHFVSQTSVEHEDFPLQKNRVRMDVMRCVKLTRLGPKLTGLELVATSNLGGSVPRRVNDFVITPYVVASQINLARYFASVRPADVFDEGDGTVLGRLLFLHLYPHRQNRDALNEKINDMIRTTNVLRAAQAKYR
jgi:hypothetical protein